MLEMHVNPVAPSCGVPVGLTLLDVWNEADSHGEQTLDLELVPAATLADFGSV